MNDQAFERKKLATSEPPYPSIPTSRIAYKPIFVNPERPIFSLKFQSLPICRQNS